MKTPSPTYPEITKALHQWLPIFSDIFQRAEEAHLWAIRILGIPTPVERANDFHRALRSNLRIWCDETNSLFQMVEEKPGQALDFMICHLIDGKPFAIRIGRYHNKTIRRNRTKRQSKAKSDGYIRSELSLFADLDEPEPGDLRQVTLAYTIENDYTSGGIPAWYMGETLLLREQWDGIALLAEIARYSAPIQIAEDEKRIVAKPNEAELKKWRQAIKKAQQGSA